jgi:thioredoxin-dependent peroxiredoxin
VKSLRESGDALRRFDVDYYAASTDAPEKNRNFAESLNADFPILSDPDGTVAEAYGVRMPLVGVPSRWTFYIGKDGRILDIDKNVKAATHGEAVATRLAELGVPLRKG